MDVLKGRLVEVLQLGGERAGILRLPKAHWPLPGQYLPCQKTSTDSSILPIHLFRIFGPKNDLLVQPLPADWRPGDTLTLLSPQGHGFSLPSDARRVGLLALGVSPLRLLALTETALTQDAALTLFCDPTPAPNVLQRIPPQVEISSPEDLQENLDWPDYLAVDIERDNLDALSTLFGEAKLDFTGEVLIRTPMPCRGLGECGVCAVETKKGWRLACVDGPVFPLAEVLHVA